MFPDSRNPSFITLINTRKVAINYRKFPPKKRVGWGRENYKTKGDIPD